mgnify:CR=1 FL=1
MALNPHSDQAFLREVDEELRRDQLATVWERYGKLLIAAIVAGLVIFGGYLFWQHRRTVAAGEEGEKLQAAFQQIGSGQAAAAEKPLAELAGSSHDGIQALALFTQADVLLQRGDAKGAAAKFAAVAADTGMARPFRDLAVVRQTATEYDTLKPQVVIDRLRPLAVPGNAYFGSAGEMLAIAYLRAGQQPLAARLFAQIGANADVPETIRQRAVQMAGSMGVPAVPQGGTPQQKGSAE